MLDVTFGANGLFGGMKLNARMNEHMALTRFEDLPKPFVCVATEISTGNEVWLTSGHLITAMRASYALPGVFEPVRCNGRLLVDGALVNPVPVSVCEPMSRTPSSRSTFTTNSSAAPLSSSMTPATAAVGQGARYDSPRRR